MASYTPNLDLLKKDPATDGADTFNIKTMLNENWDKIDESVGQRETLLKDNDTKTTPAEADSVALVESSSGKTKRLTWTRVKAVLKGYFDTVYATADAVLTAVAEVAAAVGSLDAQLSNKANRKVPASAGNLAALGADGDLADSGKKSADFAAGTHSHPKSQITDFPTSMAPTAHKVTHAIGGTDAIVPSDIGAAARISGTATLALASWTGTAAPYTYVLSIPGMLATDTPHVDRITGTDSAAAALINTAWGLIAGYHVKPQTSADKITFYATSKPSVAIPIMWEVTRA